MWCRGRERRGEGKEERKSGRSREEVEKLRRGEEEKKGSDPYFSEQKKVSGSGKRGQTLKKISAEGL
jgi:hypothetical protein